MKSCAFFGYSWYSFEAYEDKIRAAIVDLIDKGVTEFYNGDRGNFDRSCYRVIQQLRKEYPHIKHILILSYMPKEGFVLAKGFDASVYFLEKWVPPRLAIYYTNREVVKTVNYVIAGVDGCYGGAQSACDYAKKLDKTIINILSR